MTKGRMEAFSDGVFAVIITIMVLEIKAPNGPSLSALQPVLPDFLTYILSFVFVGIYWNNHHHLMQAAQHVSGGILWANLHLLFWLSLTPFVTAWMGQTRFCSLAGSVLRDGDALGRNRLLHSDAVVDRPPRERLHSRGIDWGRPEGARCLWRPMRSPFLWRSCIHGSPAPATPVSPSCG